MDSKPLSRTNPRRLKPVVRAYILAYLSTASPAIVSLVFSAIRGKVNLREAYGRCKAVLRHSAAADQIPTALAVLVGGVTLLPGLFNKLVEQVRSLRNAVRRYPVYANVLIKFIIAFGSATTCFHLLNLHPSRPIGLHANNDINPSSYANGLTPESSRKGRRRRSSVALGSTAPIYPQNIPVLAGKTMDLTSFAVVRAVGVLLSWVWNKRRHSWSRVNKYIDSLAAPAFFATSSCVIMWNWFYSPDRLPQSYCRWISSAAQIDHRLIEALRQVRFGNFVYGKDTGMAPLLASLCQELGYPVEWGDPAKSIPIPCELYHSGAGPSCERHAFKRFVTSWKFALKMYLPLNILMLSRRQPSTRSFWRACVEASQSSAFLAAFVALFYYGVCCARTRIGPKLCSPQQFPAQMCDGGICVGVGCMACGWSILLEKPGRQQEIAFFVAPRALATVLPRRYDHQFLSRERTAFALSVAVIITAAQTTPRSVHGVFGKVLAQILA